jgi:hypothetical protein
MEAYLRHVFARTADHPITPITELLPWEYRSVGAYGASISMTGMPIETSTSVGKVIYYFRILRVCTVD